ncbi:aldehyde dehydrogenase family protein [Alicyclobacillus ferrooxydans]|uniref:Aldehyde dehydrogenase n=1 Tax=Alicyclobacillus ferrooxydans TaxID=471514 RepID=A0A0P9CDX7_9BACL|nr:aldehyde dehydrogenase family protein [Alicyclobacillus ferrooxydans]KPV43801.1 aldehyde dehydrogenase [Alicyclobacillus ferrooxydans]
MNTQNLIGGEWITPNGEQMTIQNPSDVTLDVGVVHFSRDTDVLQAGEAAKQALANWAAMTPGARGNILYRIATMLEEQLEDVAHISSMEMGKPISEMKGEVMRGVHLLRYYAAEGVRATGSVIPASQEHVLQYTKRVPLGVVGIITPWNFPIAIPIWKIAPALINGNTIVWKPAEIASLSATRLTRIFVDAGLPAGVLNLVVGRGSIIGNALLEKVHLDGVSFTGSTATGMHVASLAAKRNIKYQTEMGGKNAAVVLKDADLQLTVQAVLSGAFRSAGQKCTATSRVIVEKSIYNQFIDALRKEMALMHISSALDPKSYLGPVASAFQHEKVMHYVDMARTNTEIVTEGKLQIEASSGHYVTPLVVSGVTVDDPLVQEEIFGPLMVLLPADNFDEALELCNRTVYGLSASIFTNDIQKGLRFLDEAQVGMVRVNQETAGVEYQSPFGGMKMSSSHTREQGQAALDFYSQTKTCAVYYG